MNPIIKPANEIAESFISSLPNWLSKDRLHLGKFGVSNNFCIGVEIFRSDEAFRLGAAMGDNFGRIRMSSVGIKKVMVFTEALARH